MSSGLSPENEQFLARAVSAGVYHDRDEALDDAVNLLRRRDKLIEDVNHGSEGAAHAATGIVARRTPRPAGDCSVYRQVKKKVAGTFFSPDWVAGSPRCSTPRSGRR